MKLSATVLLLSVSLASAVPVTASIQQDQSSVSKSSSQEHLLESRSINCKYAKYPKRCEKRQAKRAAKNAAEKAAEGMATEDATEAIPTEDAVPAKDWIPCKDLAGEDQQACQLQVENFCIEAGLEPTCTTEELSALNPFKPLSISAGKGQGIMNLSSAHSAHSRSRYPWDALLIVSIKIANN
jgi:hypothetical protein